MGEAAPPRVARCVRKGPLRHEGPRMILALASRS